MLIYNYQKEFLGMDEKDLKTLGFKDLSGLKAEVTDFADLFVKTPGYIHNFKHVHWIDFITCADSNEESKVIINVNNKTFKCTITINTAFLVDNPTSKAFFVQLNNLRILNAKENEKISGDIIERVAPTLSDEPTQIFNTPDFSQEVTTPIQDEEEFQAPSLTVDPYETLDIDLDDDEEDLVLDIEEFTPQVQELLIEEPQQIIEEIQPIEEDISIDVNFDDDEKLDIAEMSEVHTATQVVSQSFDNGYVYDPSVASNELGLPLDLIEEFIEDFIAQAKEFKDNLYQAVEDESIDNLKILSHKLKGVAANLRIEDALETLTVINTTADFNIATENLDELYKIIAKLSNEEIQVEVEEEVVVVLPTIEIEEELEEEISLTFKEEEPIEEDLYSDPVEIEDSQVPDKIDIPELADDTFTNEEITIGEEPSTELDLDLLTLDEEILEIEEEVTETLELPTPNFSKELAANEIGIDQESFDELYDDYIQELNLSTQSMKTAVSNGDFKACQYEALKLKGMSENMRIDSFRSELETLINSSDKQEIEKTLQRVDLIVSQISKVGA